MELLVNDERFPFPETLGLLPPIVSTKERKGRAENARAVDVNSHAEPCIHQSTRYHLPPPTLAQGQRSTPMSP